MSSLLLILPCLSIAAPAERPRSDLSDETALIVTGDLNVSSNQADVYPNPVENFLEVRGLQGEVTDVRLVDLQLTGIRKNR